jgi:methylmalonyl-CoA mutase N-terminal domain/subunit
VVGVNAYRLPQEDDIELLEPDPQIEREQTDRLRRVRQERDNSAVERALGRLGETARGTENLLYPLKEALAAYATIGEVSDVLRRAFGAYRAPAPI